MKNFFLNRKVFLSISILIYVLAVFVLGFEIKALISKDEVASFGMISLAFFMLFTQTVYWGYFRRNSKKS